MNVCLCQTGTASSAENTLYSLYEMKSAGGHSRKCIDGKITGCGNCVGYCRYVGHPGFLTLKHRDEHDCLGKGCHYFLPKPRQAKTPEKRHDDTSTHLLRLAQAKVADMEGLRILKAAEGAGGWTLSYITISNGYFLDLIAFELQEELGISVSFTRLNYNFENCVEILMAV